MIDPGSSWFKIVKLLAVQPSVASAARDTDNPKAKKTIDKECYFDKSSAMIS